MKTQRVEYDGAREAAIEVARAWESAASCSCNCDLARRARRRAATYLREIAQEGGERFAACVARILRDEHALSAEAVLEWDARGAA